MAPLGSRQCETMASTDMKKETGSPRVGDGKVLINSINVNIDGQYYCHLHSCINRAKIQRQPNGNCNNFAIVYDGGDTPNVYIMCKLAKKKNRKLFSHCTFR